MAMATSLMVACVTPGVHSVDAPGRSLRVPAERMVQVRDAWLRISQQGDGEVPVVLIHGYGSRLEAFSEVQPAISVHRKTISIDLRGFGQSERPAGSYGPEAHADDVVALLDQLGIERAVLVGHSYGASVALRVAMRHPQRVAGLVLVSPFALASQMNSTLKWAQLPVVGEWLFTSAYRDFNGEKALFAFYDGQKYVSVEALDAIEANQAIAGTTYAALGTVRGLDYGFVEAQYATISAPITVVWGEQDRVVPIRQSAEFVAHFQHISLVRVANCGHMPLWEQPGAVVKAIEAMAAIASAAQPAAVAP